MCDLRVEKEINGARKSIMLTKGESMGFGSSDVERKGKLNLPVGM